MSDDLRLLEEMASAVFLTSHGRNGGADVPSFDSELWDVLEETGLSRLTFSTEQDGGEGSLTQLLAVLRLAGKYSVAVPFAESALLAGWLLGRVGMDIPAGAMTCGRNASLSCEPVTEGWSVKGSANRVAWGSSSAFVVAVTSHGENSRAVVLPSRDCEWTTTRNMAGEPRQDFTVDRIVPGSNVAAVDENTARELRLRASLGTAVMMVGAGERAFDLTLEHVKNRTQFGRPIGHFQSVQNDIARMASYVRAASVAAQCATDACEELGFLAQESRVAVLASKAEANRSGTLIARLSHQLLGAIGFTNEHELRLSTTRLWSWCQQDGTSAQLYDQLGEEVVRGSSAWHFISPSVLRAETLL